MFPRSHSILPVMLAIIVFMFAGIPSFGYAQSITEESRKDSINISGDPSYPEPGESVEITVSSFLVSLEGSDIRWTINGQVVADGTGKTTINYTMPNNGSAANITLNVKPQNKSAITEEFTIQPVTVDLIWEANTYTPHFYPGKRLYSGVDTIKVVARPFIKKPNGGWYTRNNLIYEWQYNGLNHGSDSGLGKSTFDVDINQNNNQVSVTIRNQSGSTIAKESISIPTHDAEMVLYQKTPRRGVELAKPLSDENSTRVGRQSTIVANPYFFPISSADSDSVQYQWYAESELIGGTDENRLPVANIENTGEFQINATAESKQFIFPTIEGSALISL